MKESLSDQVRSLERENERLKAKLEKEETIRVIFKAHNGFMKCDTIRRADVQPEIRMPEPLSPWSDYKRMPSIRIFRLDRMERNLSGKENLVIYKEV